MSRSQNPSRELSREEWISSFLLRKALRPRLRSLPLVWMAVVTAVVFPIGLWSQLDSVGAADESKPEATQEAVKTEESSQESGKESPEPVSGTFSPSEAQSEKEVEKESPKAPVVTPAPKERALPVFSVPILPKLDIKKSDARKVRVRVIVSGKVIDRQIDADSKTTVRDAIEACDLKLDALDRVSPSAGARLGANQTIRITRIRTETKKRTTAIEPGLRYRPTAALRAGKQKVENAGRTGLIEVSERVWFKDGKVAHRESLGKRTIRQPQDKVIALGTRSYYMPGKVPFHNRYARAYSLAARAGSPRDRIASHSTKSLRPVRSITLVATGYSPDPRENGGYTVTATGLPIGYGAAATDPRVIPLGTKMYVEGYGYAFACDVGGAIKGKRIDLAYDSYRLANTKGRKKVRVWILAP